ncbi:peptidase U62 [Candidatus Acidianus copahuensis]|uniref:Peptidase U62 n=1 Tax=Candidatus Acidianus copahuensis TaxID=1160895 RepID=A0A031LPF7_9CREN|nr:TldD/PmbA family protein [Candidatus Acidianus copahuensis]EZQ06650.1 peptidase U62 [Candidatus Acidianus copahuensis]
MNDEMIDYVKKVNAQDCAVLKFNVKRIVIKLVESKVETVQRMNDKFYLVALRKGERGFTGKLDNLEGEPTLVPSSIAPRVSDNDRQILKVKESNVDKLMDDVSPLLNLESKFPLYGIITVEKVERSLVTSSGFNGKEEGSGVSGYFRAKNGEYSGQWAFSSTNFSEKQVKDAIERANQYASITGKAQITDGKYDLVLSPLVMGNLMMDVARMASGFAIYSGMSMMNPGDKVGSDNFTLLDTPREDRPDSWAFDDEGVFTYNKAIIENGVFKQPLLNIELSPFFKANSTGNAGWLYPRAWNLEVKEGDESVDSMVSGNVILINNVWYTRFQNYVEGTFSTVARDASVVYKEGNPVGIAERIRIADSLKKIMQTEAISKERFSVRWWDAPMQGVYPFVLVKGVKVTKA